MLRFSGHALVLAALVAPSALAADPQGAAAFRFAAVSEASLGLWEGDRPVLVYNHGQITPADQPGSRGRSCYFHPVHGLDGEALTDDFPKDHTYHRGLYCAWPHIKIGEREYELWTARGDLQQVFVRWLAKEAGDRGAKLGIENGWFVGDKQVVREQVWVHVLPAAKDSRAIDFALTWTPLDEPLTLRGAEGKSYGGFNFRFGPRTRTVITVPENAALPEGISAAAGRVAEDLLVTRLPWVDLAGDFRGAAGSSGAAIFVHPAHRDFPPTWMARHYGLVSVGWPGVEPQTFPAGQEITCRYRLWIHRKERSAADIQKQYEAYAAAAR
jgi:hypothetical protein